LTPLITQLAISVLHVLELCYNKARAVEAIHVVSERGNPSLFSVRELKLSNFPTQDMKNIYPAENH